MTVRGVPGVTSGLGAHKLAVLNTYLNSCLLARHISDARKGNALKISEHTTYAEQSSYHHVTKARTSLQGGRHVRKNNMDLCHYAYERQKHENECGKNSFRNPT